VEVTDIYEEIASTQPMDDTISIYLAGPISDGPNPFAWHEQIEERWPDITWINPFKSHTYPRSEAHNHVQEIITEDLNLVRSSDAVLLRRVGGRNLAGASIECYEANRHGIPVVIWNDAESEVPLFLNGHSEEIMEDLSDAVNAVLRLS
jgi:nucleoside 2-deoxyribosyltransferase